MFFIVNNHIAKIFLPLSWVPSTPLSYSPRKLNFRTRTTLSIPAHQGETLKKWLTFSLTFSNDEGETTEKQTKKTSVCG